MRTVLISSLTFGVLAGAACAIQALPSPSRPASASVAASGALNPTRAADRQMLSFGAAHPDCPLWTNWEKLCSRTGPGGSVRCNSDPNRRVEPSTPFCAAGLPGAPEQRQGEELASSERFCTQRQMLHGLTVRGVETPIPICTRYERDRPFNGRRIATLLHPWCRAWSDAATGRLVCMMGGRRGHRAPACERLAATRYEYSNLLVCSSWSRATPCSAPQPAHRTARPSEVWIDDPITPDSFPVRGVACEE